MTEPDLKIVDTQNRPIGQASKEEVWRKGLVHQITRITIFDDPGRILVQKRAKTKNLYPGRWDNSAAGHVDAGETFEEAALREIKEELGLDIENLEIMGDYYVEVINEWRTMKRFTRCYSYTLTGPLPKFNLPPDEVESVAWMTVDEIKNLVRDNPEQVTDGLEQVASRYL